MHKVQINGVELAYIERGQGEQTVVLAHSFLVDHRQFNAQIEALAAEYRVIAYDHRDHGRSGRATGDYPLEDLVTDAVGLIGHAGAAPCHWVGLSTGGFVGLRLALEHPGLLRSLTLMDTSARPEPPLKRLEYEGLLLALRLFGLGPLLGKAMRAMFGDTTLQDPARAGELAVWRERIAANDPAALGRFGRAIFRRKDISPRLGGVDVPTLVIVGAEDRALPPEVSRGLAEGIPGARLEVLEAAGHLSTIERPEAVNALLVPFLASASRD